MIETLKVGNTYIGAVTLEKFTISEIKKRYSYATEEEIRLLCSKSGKTIRASVPHILWLIKSGGFVKA